MQDGLESANRSAAASRMDREISNLTENVLEMDSNE